MIFFCSVNFGRIGPVWKGVFVDSLQFSECKILGLQKSDYAGVLLIDSVVVFVLSLEWMTFRKNWGTIESPYVGQVEFVAQSK